MTTYNWNAWAAKIEAKLAHYGAEGFIRPKSGPDVPVRYLVGSYDERERESEMIQFADQKVFVSPVGVPSDPTPNDRFVFEDGEDHRIITALRHKPADKVLCYVLQVRT